jgi:hypothetical protein
MPFSTSLFHRFLLLSTHRYLYRPKNNKHHHYLPRRGMLWYADNLHGVRGCCCQNLDGQDVSDLQDDG